MRILHVVPTYVPAWRHGGPVRAVHGLCAELARRGHQVSVLTTDVHADGRLDVPLGVPVSVDGVEVTYLPTAAPRRLYRAPALGAAVERTARSTDVAHLHSVFLLPTTVAARACRRQGVPYLLAPRGMLVAELLQQRGSLRKRLWIAAFERRNLRRAAAIHVTSHLEARELAALRLAFAPLALLPNGVDAPATEPQSHAAPVADIVSGPPYVMFLGRLSWKKGIDRLIEAMADLPDHHLVVVGGDDEGCRAALEALAGRLGVASRIRFTGHLDGSAKQQLLTRALALAVPSINENFGNVALEALAVGTPVVLTAGVGLAEDIAGAGAGLVSEPAPSSLAVALESLIGDEGNRRLMGERGRALVAERFSWRAIGDAAERLYAAVAARRPIPADLLVAP